MIKIRKLNENDRESIAKICIATADKAFLSSEKMTKAMLIIYNDYYLRHWEHCFVAQDEEGHVIGYILSSPYYDEYSKDFKKHELKKARYLGLKFYILAMGELKVQKINAKKYTAHLHIDILDEYQGQGIGTALMNTLIEHLQSIGVHGVQLCVSEKNKNAINFYKKNGLDIISKRPFVMAKTITEVKKHKEGQAWNREN